MVTIPPSNSITYLEPLIQAPKTMADLLGMEHETLLAENAINWFFHGNHWTEKDFASLTRAYARKGWNIFIWKYYRVSRCYIGGYKALSATLMLRSI